VPQKAIQFGRLSGTDSEALHVPDAPSDELGSLEPPMTS
jgi:hypothetical protein